jgi:hypothetical protein
LGLERGAIRVMIATYIELRDVGWSATKSSFPTARPGGHGKNRPANSTDRFSIRIALYQLTRGIKQYGKYINTL